MRQEMLDATRRGERLFRNNVGMAWMGKAERASSVMTVTLHPGDVVVRHARPVKFGLMVGSGDLIGWRSETITADMVGQKIARFLSRETKVKNNKPSPEQANWKTQVNAAGGDAEIVTR